MEENKNQEMAAAATDVVYVNGVNDAGEPAPVVQDVSQPLPKDVVHKGVLGETREYRKLTEIKVLVDAAFNDVAAGKLNPRLALESLRMSITGLFRTI